MVQWLRLRASTAGVQSLVGEVRSCMLQGVAKKLKKQKQTNKQIYIYGCKDISTMPGTHSKVGVVIINISVTLNHDSDCTKWYLSHFIC